MHHNLKKLEVELKPRFSVKTSLVSKIFIVYFILTILDLSIIFIYLGSNQIKQIGKNAILSTENAAYEVLTKFKPLRKRLKNAIKKKKPLPVNAMKKSIFASISRKKGLAIERANLYSESGKLLAKILKDDKETDNKKIKLALLKTSQLKTLANRAFYADLDVLDYRADVYLPITKVGKKRIILLVRLALPSIQEQFHAIILASISILILTLAIQALFGFYLFRVLIRRLKTIEKSTEAMAAGNLEARIPVKAQNDELDKLSYSFNTMAQALSERSKKLNQSLEELDKSYHLLEDDLILGEEIQRSILPEVFDDDNMHGQVTFRPLSNVSGDFYDLFAFKDNSTGILLLDASGHGVPAALVTMMAKIGFAESIHLNKEPKKVIEHVNNELYENLQKTGNFITAFYLVINKDGRASYVNAAHTKTIIIRKKTQSIEFLKPNSYCLGFFHSSDSAYNSAEIQLEKQDRVILYTDGITEAINSKSEPYEELFYKSIENHLALDIEKFHQAVLKDFEDFFDPTLLVDDYTIVSIEIK